MNQEVKTDPAATNTPSILAMVTAVGVACALLVSPSAEARYTQKALIKSGIVAAGGILIAQNAAAKAPKELVTGRVVGVTDGDTITVLTEGNRPVEVRLAFVDAPETSCHKKQPSPSDDACVERGQAFGKTAKRALSALVYGKTVTVQPIDKSYDRVVGRVSVDGRDINLMQVRQGMAWVYPQYAKRGLSAGEYSAYVSAQNSAQRERAGLWSAPDAVEPWEYRNTKRSGPRP